MTLPTWNDTGVNQYDYAIGGIPFLSAVDGENNLYVRESAQVQKQQFDNARQVGEQSLQSWWYRSQASFDLGAGLKYFDIVRDEEYNRRFYDSKGVDAISKMGEVRLLPRVQQARNKGTGEDKQPSLVASFDFEVLVSGTLVSYYGYIFIKNNQIYMRSNGLDKGPFTHLHSTTPRQIIDIEIEGETLFYVAQDGIFSVNLFTLQSQSPGSITGIRTTITDFTVVGSSITVNATTPVTGKSFAYNIERAKDRLFFIYQNNIYQAPNSTTPTTNATRLYAHPNTTFHWTAVADAPGAVFFAGFAGKTSAIYRSVLDSTGITLGEPSVIAELPTGEICYSMITYMGTYVVLGTNRGVRVGIITADSTIVLGPLTIESDRPVYALYAEGNFVYAGGAIADNQYPDESFGTGGNTDYGQNALYKINLSQTIGQNSLFFPWQKDVFAEHPVTSNYDYTAYVSSITRAQDSNEFPRFLFTLDSTSGSNEEGLYSTQPEQGHPSVPEVVVNGWLKTGKIRFDTSDKKIFQYLNVGISNTGEYFGNLEVRYLTDADIDEKTETFTSLGAPTYHDSFPAKSLIELDGSDALPHNWIQYQFIIGKERNAQGTNVGGETKRGPLLQTYQIKANPALVKQTLIQLPLLCRGKEKTKTGRMVERNVFDRVSQIQTLEKTGAVVMFQDMASGEESPCIIERVQFVSDQNEQRTQAPDMVDGTLTVTVRLV
jgi:hypothetical protein